MLGRDMPQRVQNLRRATTTAEIELALSLAGRRWALRVVWELRVGPLNFRALRTACGDPSPSVLQRRLHELGDSGVIEKIPQLGYRLSANGERLFQVLAQLDKWSVCMADER